MTDSENPQSLKSQIKSLEQKKATLTDAAEIKAVNKQINALQEEIGKLKSDIRLYASLNRDSIRDYHEMVLGIWSEVSIEKSKSPKGYLSHIG